MDERNNNFDFDFILGYVPRTENEHIAMMLDMDIRTANRRCRLCT